MPTGSDVARVRVLIDQRRVATISVDQVQELGLTVDMPCDEILIDRIMQAQQLDMARKDAQKMLSRSARSCARVSNDLDRKGYDVQIIQRVIDELQMVQLLDDHRLALDVIRNQREKNSVEDRLLEHKLLQMGVSEETIAQALAQERNTEPALQRAVRLIELKKGEGDSRAAARAAGLLARRGFDEQTVVEAISRVFGDPGDADGWLE